MGIDCRRGRDDVAGNNVCPKALDRGAAAQAAGGGLPATAVGDLSTLVHEPLLQIQLHSAVLQH